ncbi:HEPN domain-containing protein [Candidatus Woesearchaeota archaeon]|nr:HEPN domain-containing protein [Candidatus Woesearchaeota archaeon]
MKRTNFLIKLNKKGIIDIVKPSDEISQSYIMKSESNLISAKILLANERLEESVGLAYYSMYHSLTALLFKIGIKSENHNASIILLKELVGLSNNDILNAKKERVDKQYYVNFMITKEAVNDTIKQAERFNSHIVDFISKINNEDINTYRKKFIKLIKE